MGLCQSKRHRSAASSKTKEEIDTDSTTVTSTTHSKPFPLVSTTKQINSNKSTTDKDKTNPSTSIQSTMDALKSDAAGFLLRYKTALQLQRKQQLGKKFTKNERGTLLGTLSLLYAHEEELARDAIRAASKKQKQELQLNAATVAFQHKFTVSASSSASASNAGAEALAAAKAEAASSLQPIPLSTQCNVCYSDFNTVAPISDDQPPLVLRMKMRLCGHSSICSDCFTSYLTNRITSQDTLPFIPCPEPNCKLPLSHSDITAYLPTPEEVQKLEADYLKEEEIRVHRNNAAFDAMHADALHFDGSNKNTQKGKTHAKKAKKKSPSKASSTTTSANNSSNSNSDDENDQHDDRSSSDDSSTSSAPPIAPAFIPTKTTSPAVERVPIISTELLLQLVQHDMHKLLLRCKEFLPCGTFKLPEKGSVAASASESELSPFDLFAEEAKDSTAEPAPSSSSKPCPFGFLLLPPHFNRHGPSKTKLKKCDHCGLLQELKLKVDENQKNAAKDDGLAELLASGALRPCPICDALQMKDVGMCNILQCHSCQIWWNWASRETGKNQAALKDQARMKGTMWEPGELAYQLKLQREDPEAFKALLAKNGIVYQENYVRGWSH